MKRNYILLVRIFVLVEIEGTSCCGKNLLFNITSLEQVICQRESGRILLK